ncbi:hypothetical protein [uncultured Polaribacter sp.]|uniref:hypothetical protein n=1 Tax=uncultured Polaribacter sp. TaxID=174711 RepID=UPI00261AFAF9|nr:hypothetical protein [uncultured Polaribacter sp.]
MKHLFHSIYLLSDNKSFSIDCWNLVEDNLWLLAHFGDLEIISKKIMYAKLPRKNEGSIDKSKRHTLRKKVNNTIELLEYLCKRKIYIYSIEIEFKNKTRIKLFSNLYFNINTNSTEDRNSLINLFMKVSGMPKFDIDTLKPNYDYYLRYKTAPVENGFAMPSEFWSKENRDAWYSDSF